MSIARHLRRLRDDRRGVTVVEFAIIALPLCFTITAILDLGYNSYVNVMAQGALQVASRDAAIAVQTPAQIEATVRRTMSPLVRPEYVSTAITSFFNYSRIGKPERLTDDRNSNGRYDPGDCFEDANDNNRFDTALGAGRNTGGNADEVVIYTITLDYPRILPMASLAGWSSRNRIVVSAPLRNQPFARNVAIPIRCI